MRLTVLLFLIGALHASGAANAAEPTIADEVRGEYRVTTLRAAPGKWVEMKALIEGQGEAGAAGEDGRIATYRMRHSQGAPWDFLLIQPIAGLQHYFSAEVQAREAGFRASIAELADFEEDWFVEGPAHATLKQTYPEAGAFLIEMFRARAGMKQALFDSRVKENRFLEKIDTPANFVFAGNIGADWDVMTIGFYRDFAHWGSAGNAHSAEVQEQAAREVGYESVSELAPGLRALLTWHQDTLASAMD